MDSHLIFDVGMHRCEDVAYYLWKGYRVFALDADPRLVDRARDDQAAAVQRGRLILLHCAVAAEDGEVELHLSEQTLYNSLKKELAGRENRLSGSVRVPARRLPELFREQGVPLYCKIDVEGYDSVCLATLEGAPELPRYISVETECSGDHDRLTDAQALETLNRLYRLGYRRFKLVDQSSLAVLSPSVPAFRERPTLWERVRNRLGLGKPASYSYGDLIADNRRRLRERHGYEFPESSSGPFGEDLDGEWLDYRAARRALLRHRWDYFHMSNAQASGFWCDWHATF
jgi:FkbM family methyltransferase